jgi:hypothetical protein
MHRLLIGVVLLSACRPSMTGRLANAADSALAGRRASCGPLPYMLERVPFSPYGGAKRPLKACADTATDTVVLLTLDANDQVLAVTRGLRVSEAAAAGRFRTLAEDLTRSLGRGIQCRPAHAPDVSEELVWNADSSFTRLKYEGNRFIWREQALGTGWCETGPADTARAGA